MTKFNELLTASPVQFAAVFGAVSADAGPAPINVRPAAGGLDSAPPSCNAPARASRSATSNQLGSVLENGEAAAIL
jgi:hypothetical protein